MFGKFMNKKFFHPGSYPNIRRKWIAEQKALAKEKTEQAMKEQYEKEQSTYQNKLLITKKEEDKIKLGLNFMYDLPPGMKKEDDDNKEDGDEEVKFEWQKKAPRANYTKNLGLDVHDQPFGVCVRNVKCFRCGKWGHQNVDKECPLYHEKKETGNAATALDSMYLSDPLRLISDMRKEHGLTLRKSVIGREIDPMAENQQILDSDEENSDIDAAFIESLSDKQKRKLLRKLEKMEKKEEKRQKSELKKRNKKVYHDEETIKDMKEEKKKGIREKFGRKEKRKADNEQQIISKDRYKPDVEFSKNSSKKDRIQITSKHSDNKRKRKLSNSSNFPDENKRLRKISEKRNNDRKESDRNRKESDRNRKESDHNSYDRKQQKELERHKKYRK